MSTLETARKHDLSIPPVPPQNETDMGSEDIKAAVQASVAAESEDSKLWGFVPNWFRKSVGPLFLIFTPPYFVVLFWHVLVELDGSSMALIANIKENGRGYFGSIVPSPVDYDAWKYILGFG